MLVQLIEREGICTTGNEFLFSRFDIANRIKARYHKSKPRKKQMQPLTPSVPHLANRVVDRRTSQDSIPLVRVPISPHADYQTPARQHFNLVSCPCSTCVQSNLPGASIARTRLLMPVYQNHNTLGGPSSEQSGQRMSSMDTSSSTSMSLVGWVGRPRVCCSSNSKRSTRSLGVKCVL